MEWLGLVKYWEGIFLLIKPGFKGPTCIQCKVSNVNFEGAIFECNFGFVDRFFYFCDAFLSNVPIGHLSTVALVRVS